MSSKNLPKYVDGAITDLWNQVSDWRGGKLDLETCDEMARDESLAVAALVAAIHRYARWREAAALKRAARMLDALAVHESDNGLADSLPDDCAEKVRALIKKGTANG